MSRNIGQSVCAVCGQPAHPGAGTVLAFGAGGRVHTKTCLKNAPMPAINDEQRRGGSTDPGLIPQAGERQVRRYV
jgi:hypothetical protein